jgi:hypothetical protein
MGWSSTLTMMTCQSIKVQIDFLLAPGATLSTIGFQQFRQFAGVSTSLTRLDLARRNLFPFNHPLFNHRTLEIVPLIHMSDKHGLETRG